MLKEITMNNDIFNGFTVNIFLDEDGDYLAHFVEMPNISAFADTSGRGTERTHCCLARSQRELPKT